MGPDGEDRHDGISGIPLAPPDATGKDTVCISFRRLMEKVEVDGGRGFYGLRKTGATRPESIDPAATELYLSHSEKGMKRHYAQRDWSRLERALVRMEEMLGDVIC